MNIADLDSTGKVQWIICRHCKKKYLLKGGSKHIRMCTKKPAKKKNYDM